MIQVETSKTQQTIEKTTFSIGTREQTEQWDFYTLNGKKIAIATDRVVAFQRMIGTVVHKGQIIAEVIAFFADKAKDICTTDVIEKIHHRVLVLKNIPKFPVSFIVYGYLTASGQYNVWEQYKNGHRNFYGQQLPAGLKENQKYETPLIIPFVQNKPVGKETLFAEGLVDEDLFYEAEEMCKKIFLEGSEHATARNVILAHSFYEFGIEKGSLVLLSGFHLPGTAKYWYAEEYEQRFTTGQSQKEFMQMAIPNWLHTVGFAGNGPAPPIPEDVAESASTEFKKLGEQLLGKKIVLEKGDILKEIETAEIEYKKKE